MVMLTVLKIVVTVLVSAILTDWYLSDHPRPMSNADTAFEMVSILTTMLLVFLIWRIHVLREEKKQLELVRKFVRSFLDPETLQSAVDQKISGRAVEVDHAVRTSILFQKGGMKALGILDHDEETEESQALRFQTLQTNIEVSLKIAKARFWELYELAESCKTELYVTVKTPRSYKSYLSKQIMYR